MTGATQKWDSSQKSRVCFFGFSITSYFGWWFWVKFQKIVLCGDSNILKEKNGFWNQIWVKEILSKQQNLDPFCFIFLVQRIFAFLFFFWRVPSTFLIPRPQKNCEDTKNKNTSSPEKSNFRRTSGSLSCHKFVWDRIWWWSPWTFSLFPPSPCPILIQEEFSGPIKEIYGIFTFLSKLNLCDSKVRS